jgi:hypothetical protein
LIEQAKEGKIKEKVFGLIEDHAVLSDSPPEVDAAVEAAAAAE